MAVLEDHILVGAAADDDGGTVCCYFITAEELHLLLGQGCCLRLNSAQCFSSLVFKN